MGLVVPAVLPASRQELEKGLALIAQMHSVSRVQIDVVDGRFATPASWPYSVPAELSDTVRLGAMLPWLDRLEYEIDLMCLDAFTTAMEWLALGASRLTFHAESTTDLPRQLASTKKRYGGGFASGLVSLGLALNLKSDLALIEPCLGEIEYVQFMGVARIGRQGQPFDRRVYEKVRVFRERHPEVKVQVDGGISLQSAKELVALGVSSLVIGSKILGAVHPAAAVASFEALQTSYGV